MTSFEKECKLELEGKSAEVKWSEWLQATADWAVSSLQSVPSGESEAVDVLPPKAKNKGGRRTSSDLKRQPEARALLEWEAADAFPNSKRARQVDRGSSKRIGDDMTAHGSGEGGEASHMHRLAKRVTRGGEGSVLYQLACDEVAAEKQSPEYNEVEDGPPEKEESPWSRTRSSRRSENAVHTDPKHLMDPNDLVIQKKCKDLVMINGNDRAMKKDCKGNKAETEPAVSALRVRHASENSKNEPCTARSGCETRKVHSVGTDASVGDFMRKVKKRR
ncbi:MAG: hypothetical protein SGPRY_003457 [Prymnesium sp.]